MAIMREAEWLGEHSPRNRMARFDIVCIHTIVGYAPAHAAHFSTTGGGRLLQSRDTAYQSAANLRGNPRIIAIENADHGAEFNQFGADRRQGGIPPLTQAQVDRCAEVLQWANRVHGVPLQLCPDSRPGSRGLAYHRQGIDGNFGSYRFPGRVSGGEVWTSAYGKICPTDPRIMQLPEILALAREEDEMREEDFKRIERIVEAKSEAAVHRALDDHRFDVGREKKWGFRTIYKTLLPTLKVGER